MTEGLVITLPPAVFEQLVTEVTERLKAELAEESPWLNRKQAAKYLAVPLSRLEKDATVPSHRWSGRVFYSRPELDAWLNNL